MMFSVLFSDYFDFFRWGIQPFVRFVKIMRYPEEHKVYEESQCLTQLDLEWSESEADLESQFDLAICHF
jgi:hypothetical protein